MSGAPTRKLILGFCILALICFLYIIFSRYSPQQLIVVKRNFEYVMSNQFEQSTVNEELTTRDKVRTITNCYDKHRKQRIETQFEYFVLYNYVQSALEFKCEESITFTTHADVSFMKHLPIIVERWQGPVSIALHAPGTDFIDTINTILYMKYCSNNAEDIDKWVSFHIYFGHDHIPDYFPPFNDPILQTYNCEIPPFYKNINKSSMYKHKNKLLYPINLARNIARAEAQTHFVFAIDIELYPSLEMIPKFLKMIADDTDPALQIFPRVFALPEFEVDIKNTPPRHKKELVGMVRNGSVIPFHKTICSACHAVPEADKWLEANVSDDLNVLAVGKRVGKNNHWEAVFIGTKDEPIFDERFYWEGMSDKMTNGFKLCALNYSYLVLDNAFVAHSPGIKKAMEQTNPSNKFLGYQNNLIWTKYYPQYKKLYNNSFCIF